MNYDWYNLFNKTEFEAEDLTSRTLTLDLEGVGVSEVLVTKGNMLGITYQGVFLPINLDDKNPFDFEGYAVYLDENDDVHLGIAVDEA